MDQLTPEQREALARTRFFTIGALRLGGGVILIAGMLLAAGRFALTGGDTDRWIGGFLMLFGFFDFFILPILLARAWKTPAE